MWGPGRPRRSRPLRACARSPASSGSFLIGAARLVLRIPPTATAAPGGVVGRSFPRPPALPMAAMPLSGWRQRGFCDFDPGLPGGAERSGRCPRRPPPWALLLPSSCCDPPPAILPSTVAFACFSDPAHRVTSSLVCPAQRGERSHEPSRASRSGKEALAPKRSILKNKMDE